MLPMPKLQSNFPQSRPLQPSSFLLLGPNQKSLHQNFYTLRENLFEKLDGFSIEYTKKTLLKTVAVFKFESICVPSEELKPTKSIT